MTKRSHIDRPLCIDADVAVYACAFIAEKKTHYAIVDGKVVYQVDDKRKYNKWLKEQDKYNPDDVEYDVAEELLPFSECKIAVDGYIKQIVKLARTKRLVVLLTKGGACFRTFRATLKKYKGNRDKMKKPVYYQEVRDYLVDKYKAKIYNKWEADDTACMFMAKMADAPDTAAVLAAVDKDLEQMACMHVNPNKKAEGLYMQTEVDGWWCFYKQMLMGDAVDNIPGLPGVGEKKAEKLLEGCSTPEEMCDRVYTEYAKVYGSEHTYTPWWWDTETYNDEMLEDYHDRELVLRLREERPEKELTVPAWEVFRENADLLYMLRTPDDQYVPHCEYLQKELKPYPNGIVAAMLGD